MSKQATPVDPSVQRIETVIELAADLGQPGPESSRHNSALITLRTLSTFVRRQCEFLYTGLKSGGQFERDDRYSLPFLLEATARQASFDVDVLLRTIAHREATASTPTMRTTLALADRLALDAIEPAVRHGLVERTVVLTYFQKSPTIRLIPYAPLALIGFDFSAIGDPGRLVAIGHEMGHHVYRQMTINYTSNLDAQIGAMGVPAPAAASWPSWLMAWQEEIFADIYGVLVAGPVAALALQELILTGPRTSLVIDDGDHPIDALRPEILHTTIRAMARQRSGATGKTLERTADLLDARWQEMLAKRLGAPVAFIPAGAASEGALPLAEASALLRRFVGETLHGALAPIVADTSHALWSEGVARKADGLEPFYGQFADTCERVAGRPMAEPALQGTEQQGAEQQGAEQQGAEQKVVVDNYAVEGRGGERVAGEIGDPYLDTLRESGLNGKTLRADEWKAVFLAGDWVTEEGGSGINPV